MTGYRFSLSSERARKNDVLSVDKIWSWSSVRFLDEDDTTLTVSWKIGVTRTSLAARGHSISLTLKPLPHYYQIKNLLGLD